VPIPDKVGMRLGAIILAGGRSVRMGRPKELLPFGSGTLLGHVVRELAAVAAHVLVIARDPQQELGALPAGTVRLHDATPDPGPLAGLVAGLRQLRHAAGFDADDAALLCGCDQPFLTSAVVVRLQQALGDHDLVLPEHDDRQHPLAAIYRLRLLPRGEALLAAGAHSPRALLADRTARVLQGDALRQIDPTLRFLANLNHPADYAAALHELPRAAD
jgi:molybdopterin-guanine dinucleotide biosynthesis protein A